MSIQKYFLLFCVQVEYISGLTVHSKMPLKPMGQPPPQKKNLLFSYGMWTPSNTPMPGPMPLTIPNDSSIDSCTFAQLHNKFPTGYNGMPTFTPKIAFPFDDLHSHLIHPSID